MADIEIEPVDNNEVEDPKEPQEQEKPKENYINDIVKKQMEQFQTQFMQEFQQQFNDKVSSFENDKKIFQTEKQKHQIKELLMKNNLEGDLLDYVYDDDIEVSKLKITELNTIINNRVEKNILNKLKSDSYTPPSNGESSTPNGYVKPPYIL